MEGTLLNREKVAVATSEPPSSKTAPCCKGLRDVHMRIHHVRLRGISDGFPKEVEVDFDALGLGLIAILGENGVGKSTLIGSIFAALFRQLPGHKRSIYNFCTHPQPEIDVTFSPDGRRFRSLLKIDPKVRQMDAYIFNEQGVAVTRGKKEGLQEGIQKHVGAAAVYIAAIFSKQKHTHNFQALA